MYISLYVTAKERLIYCTQCGFTYFGVFTIFMQFSLFITWIYSITSTEVCMGQNFEVQPKSNQLEPDLARPEKIFDKFLKSYKLGKIAKN